MTWHPDALAKQADVVTRKTMPGTYGVGTTYEVLVDGVWVGSAVSFRLPSGNDRRGGIRWEARRANGESSPYHFSTPAEATSWLTA